MCKAFIKLKIKDCSCIKLLYIPEPESCSVVSNSSAVSLQLIVGIPSILDWSNELVFFSKASEERRARITMKRSGSELHCCGEGTQESVKLII